MARLSASGISTSTSVRTGGKLGATLFFSIFLGMGLLFCVLIVRELLRDSRTYRWRETPCVIRESHVRETDGKGDGPRYALDVRYEYASPASAATRLTGSTYQRQYDGGSDYADAARLAERYRPGASTTCYVNPDNPAEAVLARRAPWFAFIILLPLLFVAIGGGGIYGTWRAPKGGPGGVQSMSARATDGAGARRVGVAFFAIFFVIGVAASAFFATKAARVVSARSWPSVPCVVESSRVRSHSGDSTTYSVDILYAYDVGGRTYKSNRYNLIGGSSSGYASKRDVVTQHPPGRRTVCYVNPNDPYDAALRTDLTWPMLFAVIPVAFVVVGGVGTLRMLRKKDAGEPARRAVSERRAPSVQTVAARAAPLYSSQPSANVAVTLTPAQSPLTKLIAIGLFALVWNVAVGFFVYTMANTWRRGVGDVCGTIFMIPFVVVGVVVIGAFFHALLALRNPRPRLTLSRDGLRLGETADLAWEFDGRYDRITRLTISVQGREEATYRRGTDTRTDKETFATIPVAETSSGLDIRKGKRSFTVPAESMHTFAGKSNKIVWSIHVHGEISRWPDVKEEFAITVRPLTRSASE